MGQFKEWEEEYALIVHQEMRWKSKLMFNKKRIYIGIHFTPNGGSFYIGIFPCIIWAFRKEFVHKQYS